MFKKLAGIAASAVLAISIVGCGSQGQDFSESSSQEPSIANSNVSVEVEKSEISELSNSTWCKGYMDEVKLYADEAVGFAEKGDRKFFDNMARNFRVYSNSSPSYDGNSNRVKRVYELMGRSAECMANAADAMSMHVDGMNHGLEKDAIEVMNVANEYNSMSSDALKEAAEIMNDIRSES